MRFRSTAVAAALGLFAVACADDPATAPGNGPSFAATAAGSKTYVIVGNGSALPSGLAAQLVAAGGTLTASLDAIGVATATSSAADFASRAARISGLRSVTPDMVVQWVPTERVIDAGDAGEDIGQASHGSNETFYNMQWGPGAISAPAAWDAGYLGTGARVAVLDGGLNNLHIDLNGSVDVAASASFVPGFAFNQDVAGFSHATHVAGIIAAQDDGVGTIGIAPGATIIGVKVLHGGSGSFGAVIQGIIFAATPVSQGGGGANIINMSLGAGFDRQGRDAAELTSALSRATTYAYQQGVTVIVSAGNSGVDIDHTNNLVFVPAQSTNVIAVAATGPMGFAVGWPSSGADLDRPASYTNFGQSAITLAAPGGDFALPGSAPCTIPRNTVGVVTFPCWVFDMVVSPGSITTNTGYSWAAGTSMASPHVAGVAALIIGKNGPMHPAQVEAILRQSADDLGKPGNDDFYGRGRVNAWRAVQ